MIKEIKYNGFTATPSDYEAPDGDLAAAINLVPEDEAFHPLTTPKTILEDLGTWEVLYIHKVISGSEYITNYILYDPEEEALLYRHGRITYYIIDSYFPHPIQVAAIGNILTILLSDDIRYFRWENAQYTVIGSLPPFIPLAFGLRGTLAYKDYTFTASGEYESSLSAIEAFTPLFKQNINANMNAFIAEKATNAGRFIFPFFVRYAFRLYDGTLARFSPPILMKTDGATPYMREYYYSFNRNDDNRNYFTCSQTYVLFALVHDLYFKINDEAALEALRKWKDIIQSLDIFISSPIYTYDQNGAIDAQQTSYTSKSSVCQYGNNAGYGSVSPLSAYLAQNSHDEENRSGFFRLYNTPIDALPIARNYNDIRNDYRNNQNFYLLKQINIDDLTTNDTKIDITASYLAALTSKERMAGDATATNDTSIASCAFVYNARLFLAGMRKKYFQGFPLDTSCCRGTGMSDTNQQQRQYQCRILLRDGSRDIVIQNNAAQLGTSLFTLTNGDGGRTTFFFYYPNTNAKTAYINPVGTDTWYKLPLTAHDFLNGAYYLKVPETIPETIPVEQVPAPTADEESLMLPIYYSDPDNPFAFPYSTTVGTGTVMAIAAATKALSQGQFGQFPLYAFTTEGVWALEISSTGTISARQPVTRDVCINPKSITSIDTAVIFATDRGIMLLSGAESRCISDSIDSPLPLTATSIQGLSSVCGDAIATISDFVPFRQFLQECRLLYDYIHQRIIAYNPSLHYAYIYSLKSRQWGMMQSDIEYHVNAYPDAIAVKAENPADPEEDPVHELVNYSETEPDTTPPTQIIITRPIKLDTPDQLKTIDTIIQRGYFRKGHVKTILYGSRDLFSWHLVASSTDHYLRGFRGTPYKYFRLALICSLQKDESISGCTIQFTPRLTAQPR